MRVVETTIFSSGSLRSSVGKLEIWSLSGASPLGLAPAKRARWNADGLTVLGLRLPVPRPDGPLPSGPRPRSRRTAQTAAPAVAAVAAVEKAAADAAAAVTVTCTHFRKFQ